MATGDQRSALLGANIKTIFIERKLDIPADAFAGVNPIPLRRKFGLRLRKDIGQPAGHISALNKRQVLVYPCLTTNCR
jgi:hypothetical protein